MLDPSEVSPKGPYEADTFLPLKHLVDVVAFDPFDWVVAAANFAVGAFEHSVVEQLVAVAVVRTAVFAADFAFADC